MNLGLRGKFLIPIVLIIAMGMAAYFALFYSRTTSAIEGQVRRDMKSDVELSVHRMDFWLRDHLNNLQTFGRNRVYRDALLERGYFGRSARRGAAEDLGGLLQGHDHYEELSLIDLEANVLANSAGAEEGGPLAQVKEEGYFQEALGGKSVVSDLYLAESPDENVFILAVPVFADGVIIGVLAGEVNARSFYIETFGLPNSDSIGFAFITDAEDNMIVDLGGDASLAEDTLRACLRPATPLRENTVVYSSQGTKRIATFARSAWTGWTYFQTQSLDRAYSLARQTGRDVAVVGLITAIVMIISVILFFREMITRRLQAVLAGISQVESGNLAIRIETSGFTDEITTLTTAFNAMTERLHDTLESLREEIRVREEVEEEGRKIEAQAQEAQKLESLGVLAGGIAHDFNNLLVGILGNADLAQAEVPEDSKAYANLREIETAAMRAADLCSQMLAYSGKGKFIIEAVDLNAYVREMAHLLDVSVSKKAALHFDLVDGLPSIEADPTQIRQVIMNLITNASEALGDGSGAVTVRTGFGQFDGAYLETISLGDSLNAGEYVYLVVSDTGCGMDEYTRSKMFDPFFTTKFTGRGLGMAAVLGIVRGHHGAVDIDTAPGKGTTFKILFPSLREPARPPQTHVPVETDWRANGTVLVVDDEAAIRTVGERMLGRWGFKVVTAATGREGIQVYRRLKDELVCVLLDLTMPDMDGVETFQAMRAIKLDIPIILCSGYDEQEVLGRFQDDGLAGFIHKPYRSALLAEKVKQAIEK